MKQFKSIERAIRRGHLKKEWDGVLQQEVLIRKINHRRWVRY